MCLFSLAFSLQTNDYNDVYVYIIYTTTQTYNSKIYLRLFNIFICWFVLNKYILKQFLSMIWRLKICFGRPDSIMINDSDCLNNNYCEFCSNYYFYSISEVN